MQEWQSKGSRDKSGGSKWKKIQTKKPLFVSGLTSGDSELISYPFERKSSKHIKGPFRGARRQ